MSASTSQFDPNPAVRAFLSARAEKRPLAALPEDARPRDAGEATAVADETARRLGPVAAWKVGASSKTAVPARAPINAATVFLGIERLSLGVYRAPLIEAEIAFRLGSDLPTRETPYTVEEVAAAIVSVHPLFEICDTRFAAHKTQDGFSHMADQQSHGALIVGPAVGGNGTSWLGHDFANQPVRLVVDGTDPIERVGGNSAGEPFRLLVWMANEGTRDFGGLKAGWVITTGSHTGAVPVRAGGSARADFPGVGSIELTFDA